MTIRPVEDGDRGAWADMRDRLWPDGFAAHLADIENFFSGDSPDIVAAFVAVEDAGPVGFIELNLRIYAEGVEESPVPYVEGWFVEEAYRGRGYGEALIMRAEDWAREQGYGVLASDSELHNEPAIRAHKALGFDEVERIVCFVKKLGSGS